MNELQYLVDVFTLLFFVVILTFLVVVLGLSLARSDRLLDRYRLKYGFDREIESKEISKEHTELKLNRREHNFKRRVFKD